MISSILRKLRREQPAASEMAAARRVFHKPVFCAQSCSPDDLVQRKGLEIYDIMQADSQVSAALTTKKFAVLKSGWEVVAESGRFSDRRAADFCRFALLEMKGSVEDMLFGVLDALAKGYSVLEVNYCRIPSGPWKGLVGISSIKHKDPSLFDFETDEFMNVRRLIRLPADGSDALSLPLEKFIVYSYMPSYEDPRGRSDLRACYKHWWSKDIILRFLATYLERHGSPVVKGTYRRGATRTQQDDLLRILNSVQQETAIVIPEDVRVELLEASFNGERGYLDAIAYHDRQIAKAILGETLTQEEGSRTGALALARVHENTMLLRLQKIRRDIEETVMREQVLRPLTRLNFAQAQVPRFQLGRLQEPDTGRLAGVLERLVNTGVVRADEPWVRNWLGVPSLQTAAP